ncbi:MAG: hypothetical protein EZS28_055674 [Streblomastix strix]|uniref:Uncharacterized protein n=1 Tax=Streblomastix strix TaxID=222440 RepID=A0A5J4PYH8_9EUKA|nr:MAG: hypothetical protein EZS28_055674 [Streblomastix strix]
MGICLVGVGYMMRDDIIVVWEWRSGGYGCLKEWVMDFAGVDGDLFGSNPLGGFETVPEPINYCTVF